MEGAERNRQLVRGGEDSRLPELLGMDERSRSWEARFEWPMVIVALLVIPCLVIEESELGEPWEAIGQILNYGTWFAFLFEAAVMIKVSPKPMAWISRHPIDVAVIFLSPPFLPGGLAAARLFRLLRVLRLLRILSVSRLLSLEGIRYAAFLALFLVLVGGMSYAAVESDQDLSGWDGIWWAVTTVTTVGYGDSFPTTDVGRVIAIVVMLTGIGFVALLTAFVAERFIREDTGAEVERFEEEILHELRAINERLTRLERDS